MATRSFVLHDAQGKRFWDISWDEAAVEITSGKWGTNGRTRNATFPSAAERDAYQAYADGLKKSARNVHKLGGFPTFVQDFDEPYAHAMFQIEMNDPFNMNFGDLGAGHLLQRADRSLRFFWSCH
jgi:predicted DNA-binding WGR domain protein